MNKNFKKYSKSRWVDTRLSRHHKRRNAYRISQAAIIARVGEMTLMSISQANTPDNISLIKKKMAIAETVIKTMQAVNLALGVREERSGK